ncbi:DUF1488 family protein [Caballeronia calidae]
MTGTMGGLAIPVHARRVHWGAPLLHEALNEQLRRVPKRLRGTDMLALKNEFGPKKAPPMRQFNPACALLQPFMETLGPKPQISNNRRGVVFVLMRKSEPVECVIARAALEVHFWLPFHADDAKILKAFCDGYSRIQAVAQRKLLAKPTSRLELTEADFVRL